MSDDRFIERDRMRFTRNSKSANLLYLAILLDVFYFINIYKSDIAYLASGHQVGNFYYQSRIGVSIIFNLVFLLAAFLSSEGVKNYKMNYVFIIYHLGLVQLVRIFILPLQAFTTVITVAGVTNRVMEVGQFVQVIIYLLLSAACCFASAYVGYKRNNELKEHMAVLDAQTAA